MNIFIPIVKRKLSYPQHSHNTFTTNPKCGSQKVLQNVIIGFVSSEQKNNLSCRFRLELITTYHLWFIVKNFVDVALLIVNVY